MSETVDLDRAIELLPPIYAAALRLRWRGVPDDEVAEELGVHQDAVHSFFALAESKLAALMADDAE
jgi:DNA-directed RNA polymerase specialized sigma24 family protein